MKRLLTFFILAYTSTSLFAADADSDVEAGRQIFEIRCADTCHQAPAASRLRPKQWRIVLNTMQTRMTDAGMNPLTEKEIQQLLQYLTEGRP